MKKVKRIGVLCSGGDCSGMNPCVRSVVRSALYYKMEPFAIYRGYEGMINDEIKPMTSRDVGGIGNRGGTIIGSARSMAFKTKAGRQKAIKNLKKHGIDGVVVIGGDGSFHGADSLHRESDILTIGVPGTIDNDLSGTDFTIGYDTAINVVLDAIDKIRDTAASHDRIFFIEVMGRHAGYIALETGIAGGAEEVVIPETKTDIKAIATHLEQGRKGGKMSSIVIVAEGDEVGGAYRIAEEVAKLAKLPARVSILGHLQRGGTPTCADRLLASRLGLASVRQLKAGKSGIMVGVVSGKIKTSPLNRSWSGHKKVTKELLDLSRILSI
ncbi:MAG: 6-phosphofructokinase [Planctomycetes bacterium]|nr:6-phosphofructokinase [Planctomycetota bacterium]